MTLFQVFCSECEGGGGYRGLDGSAKSPEILVKRDSRRGTPVTVEWLWSYPNGKGLSCGAGR